MLHLKKIVNEKLNQEYHNYFLPSMKKVEKVREIICTKI